MVVRFLCAAAALGVAVQASAVEPTFNDMKTSLFVCAAKSKAAELARLGLNEEKMRDFVLTDSNGCGIWKTSARFAVRPETQSNGAIQVQIDPENRVDEKDPGTAWTTIAQVDFAFGKSTVTTIFTKPLLVCTTLEGAKRTVPASLRAPKAGAVILSGYEKGNTDPEKNYRCFAVPVDSMALGYPETASSGFAKYRLFDEKSSVVWTVKAWK